MSYCETIQLINQASRCMQHTDEDVLSVAFGERVYVSSNSLASEVTTMQPLVVSDLTPLTTSPTTTTDSTASPAGLPPTVTSAFSISSTRSRSLSASSSSSGYQFTIRHTDSRSASSSSSSSSSSRSRSTLLTSSSSHSRSSLRSRSFSRSVSGDATLHEVNTPTAAASNVIVLSSISGTLLAQRNELAARTTTKVVLKHNAVRNANNVMVRQREKKTPKEPKIVKLIKDKAALAKAKCTRRKTLIAKVIHDSLHIFFTILEYIQIVFHWMIKGSWTFRAHWRRMRRSNQRRSSSLFWLVLHKSTDSKADWASAYSTARRGRGVACRPDSPCQARPACKVGSSGQSE